MAGTPAPAPSGDELLKVLAALGNPHRLRIVAALHEGRNYVSRLAREIGMSRPLLHMHLQRLEAAGLITGSLELSEDGKAMKFYEVVSFRYELTPELIEEVARTIGDGDGEPESPPPGKDQTGTGKPETVKEEAT